MKTLPNLLARPYLVTHLGCIHACVEYLGLAVSRPWLYGGTGHAFITNIPSNVDCSGPTAWNHRMLFDLAPNLGYRAEGMRVERGAAGQGFATRQREAWDMVRRSIDQGLPCYGWQLEAPNYYVIHGYDEVGYYYSGDGGGARGPLPWEMLGTWDVDVLEVYHVTLCDPAPAEVVVREALAAALKHAENPPEWIGLHWRSGPAAFDAWAAALEEGAANRDGHSYNAVVWHECRAMGVEFLREVKGRLPNRCDADLDEAAVHYAVVCDRLEEAAHLHPERDAADWVSAFASPAAAALVRRAADAERRGLACLQRIVAAL